MKNPHTLIASVGEFDAYDIIAMNEIESHLVLAVLITKDNTYWIQYESPAKTWDQYKPILEDILKSVTWNSKMESGDLVVRAIHHLTVN